MKFSLGKASLSWVLGFGLMASGAAQAGVLLPGNTLYEDQDWESQVTDAGGDGTLGDGDILLALLEIGKTAPVEGTIDDQFNDSADIGTSTTTGPENDTITAVSLIKVLGDPIVTGGVTAEYLFTAPTPAEWLALTGITVDAAGGTMAVLYDDPASDPDDHVDPSDPGGIPGSILTATEGDKIAEFGFAGGAGEFWEATTVSIDGDPTALPDIEILSFYAAINLIGEQDSGGTLIKHNILGDPDLNETNFDLFTDATHLQLQGANGTGGGGANFQLGTDTDLYMSVPTPGTLALLGLGLAGVGWSTRKKA